MGEEVISSANGRSIATFTTLGRPGSRRTQVPTMGLIALIFPVRADPLVARLDWPYLVGVTWLATLFFGRGRVGRPEGALLVVLYAVYVALHIAFG